MSQCTFWCSVLSDAILDSIKHTILKSQCTFWCSVLSDLGILLFPRILSSVSMHLLVLSAFRPATPTLVKPVTIRSQCTFWCSVLSDASIAGRAGLSRDGLNAPFGAQCFPTSPAAGESNPDHVSMHLLVLSAFRPTKWGNGFSVGPSLNAPFGAQCFPTGLPRSCPICPCVSMHLLVLSAFRPTKMTRISTTSSGLNAPFGAQCFPTRRRVGFGRA